MSNEKKKRRKMGRMTRARTMRRMSSKRGKSRGRGRRMGM